MHSKRLVFSFSALFLVVAPLRAHAEIVSGSEYDALEAIYLATAGPGWAVQTNWRSGDACAWYGIVCDSAGQHVVEINLADNHLVGAIPDVGAFRFAKRIDLSRNHALAGALPSLAGLTKLEEYYFNDNQLTGSIPDFSAAPAIKRIDIHANELSDLSRLSIASLTSLVHLDISHNALVGDLPDPRGLNNLVNYYANDNQLTGVVPRFFGCNAVQRIDVHANGLSSWIEFRFEDMPSLVYFDASDNLIEGTIPSLDGVVHAQEIRVADNLLSGEMPSLSDLVELHVLKVAGNFIDGEMPAPAALAPLTPGASSLCFNFFEMIDSPEWDAATGTTPWHRSCGIERIFADDFGDH